MNRRHVVLVGLPGSGKTSVGRCVARSLSAPFVDLDERIVAARGTSIAQIFAAEGEASFRALEREHVRAVLTGEPVVLASGGGFVLDDGNRAAIRALCLVVYLQTDAHEAARRLGPNPGRPLLEGGDTAWRLAQLLRRREPAYLSASYRVSTDGRTVDEVAAQVAKLAREVAGW